MEICFWGTRGSISKAGLSTLRYGGNTSCIEVRSADGTLVVLDCGTGAHDLGRELVMSSTPPQHGHILITHTHWDHIQGFPFFAPLRIPTSEWNVYGPYGANRSVRETLAGQMQYAYFPLALEDLGADVRYHDLVEGVFEIGDIRVTTQYLNHPALTLGYRLEADGVTLVYATDHEPHSRRLAMAEQIEQESVPGEDARHAEFLADADLVIHDAQYTAEEYPSRVGWGHSTVEYVVDTAVAAGVGQVALFHHDPLRDDDSVDRLVGLAKDRLDATGTSPDLFAAAEGRRVKMRRPSLARTSAADGAESALKKPIGAVRDQSVLVAVADRDLAAVLADAARAEGIDLLTATEGDAGAIVRATHPSLVMVDRDLPGLDLPALIGAIRGKSGEYGAGVGIVIISTREDTEAQRREREAGASDWLLAPVTAMHARARMRAWLMRTACRWIRAARPADEDQRICALNDLYILDTGPEERFDRHTRIAAALFRVPMALVSLVDTDRQWFKSRHGLTATETPRDAAFCAHAILGSEVLHVPDTLADDRFADNPLVTGEPHVRFYAGVPLELDNGSTVGTLCLIDQRARHLSSSDLRLLVDLGKLVVTELETKRVE